MPKPRRSVVWSRESEQDLFDISAYLTAEASAATAEKYLRRIFRAGERIRTRPLSGRARDGVMPDVRSVLVHPYVVFYRIEAASVEVVRVVHQGRDLETIFADIIDD
jgi:toxin ParE1/3/4